MAAYRIFFRKSVLKDLEKIPRKDLRKIMRRIKALGENPRPSGCEKLSSRELYRIRQGKYRIVYSIQDDVLTVWIVNVSHRKNAYR
jgi:mRNA interferase RelE/StbE